VIGVSLKSRIEKFGERNALSNPGFQVLYERCALFNMCTRF